MSDYKTEILKHCTVDVEDASTMSEEAFANIRRNGIGASDASVILGTNPWANIDELIEDKLANGLTSKNMEIAAKPAVRKGKDLEPMILWKAEVLLGTSVDKPTAMYRFKDFPWLTVNFDGIACIHNRFVPVEAKMVSQFGEKTWDFSKSQRVGTMAPMLNLPSSLSTQERCGIAATHYGIPPYYYCQLQQQMMALNSAFGYMAALRDKDWTLHLFMVYRDTPVIQDIIKESRRFWNNILAPRKNLPTYPSDDLQVEPRKLANEEDY